MTLTFQPLTTEGRVLLPVGKPLIVATDYLNSRRAVVEVCRERGWSWHPYSGDLSQRVSAETAPFAVVFTHCYHQTLMGVWIGGAL